MDDAAEQPIPAPLFRPRTGVAWDALRFLLHLAAIYAIVKFCTPPLAGWTQGWLLPLLQVPTSSGSFEFFFSHLFAFSFIPAFLTGLVNARFKHKIAQYVWLVPTVILIYKIARFSTAVSVLYGNPPSAFDHYFGGDFLIPEWHDWKDFWTIASSNPDMSRGMDQFTFTAPFYAGIGYSLAACVAIRMDLNQRIGEKIKTWEKSRFGGDE